MIDGSSTGPLLPIPRGEHHRPQGARVRLSDTWSDLGNGDGTHSRATGNTPIKSSPPICSAKCLSAGKMSMLTATVVNKVPSSLALYPADLCSWPDPHTWIHPRFGIQRFFRTLLWACILVRDGLSLAITSLLPPYGAAPAPAVALPAVTSSLTSKFQAARMRIARVSRVE